MTGPLEAAWARELEGDARAEYERFVEAAAGGHYAQTPAWDEVMRSIRAVATRYLLVRREGRLVGAARVTRPTAVGLPLPVASVERGPVVADLAELPGVLGVLARTAGGHGIARLTAMPYWAGEEAEIATRALAAGGWKDTQGADGAHARTLRLDLGGDVFAGKERESLRRKLRQAEKAGATVREAGAEGIDPLHALYAALMTGQGRSGRPRAYFQALHDAFVARGSGAFFLAEHEGEPLAALFALRHGSVATFVLGASASADRPFSKMAPPMAAAVRWAQAHGCRTFDLGGIPMEGDDDPKRASIAQFKLDFAKTPVPLAHEHARTTVPGMP